MGLRREEELHLAPSTVTVAATGKGSGGGRLRRAADDPRRTVRVASVPASHVYTRHIRDEAGQAWEVLPDPTRPWWPPVMLDPAWVSDHAECFDLMHVHFGFDGVSPASLRAVTRALDAAGRPLVLTVHDLRNPHHPEPGLHEAQLQALVSGASRVITLTEGAAGETASRYGRWAIPLPHPHVFPIAGRRRCESSAPRVGIHLKSLRENMVAPLQLVRAAAQACVDTGAVLRVDVHRDVAAGDRHDPSLMAGLGELAVSGIAEVCVHDYFTDDELESYLASLAVSVLPYRFGTHSGWLEACRDVGTRVVAPTCGHYAGQWDEVVPYANDEEHGLDPASLGEAIILALALPSLAPADPAFRRSQRAGIAEAHLSVYREALA